MVSCKTSLAQSVIHFHWSLLINYTLLFTNGRLTFSSSKFISPPRLSILITECVIWRPTPPILYWAIEFYWTDKPSGGKLATSRGELEFKSRYVSTATILPNPNRTRRDQFLFPHDLLLTVKLINPSKRGARPSSLLDSDICRRAVEIAIVGRRVFFVLGRLLSCGEALLPSDIGRTSLGFQWEINFAERRVKPF